MFDEYYVVLCGTYRTTSTNECDHHNKYTYFIIARSFARPPSLLLLLCHMVIGMALCFEVMNAAVHVWREYSYTCTYRSTRVRRMRVILTTNACIQLPTAQQTYTLFEYTSCLASAGHKTRGSSTGSRVTRGVRFHSILNCSNRFREKNDRVYPFLVIALLLMMFVVVYDSPIRV